MRTVCALIVFYGMAIMNIEAGISSQSLKDRDPHAVTLRGQVESVEMIPVSPSDVSIDVKLKLEIKNNGVQPLIFLKENVPILVGYALTRNSDRASPENRLAFSYTGPGIDTSSEWAALRKSLDQPSPPPDKVRILMPNETWYFNDIARIFLSTKAGNKSVFPENANWEAVQELSPVWLHVIYQTWPLNVELSKRERSKLAFGHKLQLQWKHDGLLWLESLHSEPIKLSLRDSKQ